MLNQSHNLATIHFPQANMQQTCFFGISIIFYRTPKSTQFLIKLDEQTCSPLNQHIPRTRPHAAMFKYVAVPSIGFLHGAYCTEGSRRCTPFAVHRIHLHLRNLNDNKGCLRLGLAIAQLSLPNLNLNMFELPK